MKVQLFFLTCCAVNCCRAAEQTLRFVQAVWRHGDRSPSSGTFPTDTENGENTWIQGWGELSQKGIKQMYERGKFLRNRYDGFLSKQFNSKEVRFLSTDYNRTIMSALSVSAGLFEPAISDRWKADLAWRPVPIHSFDHEAVSCPTLNAISPVRENREEVLEVNRRYAEFFEYLKQKTGKPQVKLFDISRIYDPLFCEMKHNRTLPKWVNSTTLEKILRLIDVQYEHSYPYDMKQFLRLDIGQRLEEIVGRLEQKAKNSSFPLKFHAFSAHDSTLAPLLASLGAFNNRFPPYGAMILLELHQMKDKEFIVKLFYSNESDHEPYRLSIGECADDCLINDFVARSQPFIPIDWELECGINSWSGISLLTWTKILLVICGLLTALVLVLVVLLCCFKRRGTRYLYQSVRLLYKNDDEFSESEDAM